MANRPDIRYIREQAEALGQRFAAAHPQITNHLDYMRIVNYVKKYAVENPISTMIISVMALLGSIPILTFICFVVATLGFTFMAFVFVEGTLLTMGTFLLSGVLFVIGFLALGFSAFIAAAWLFFNKAFSLVSSASQRLTPKPFLNSPREHSLQHVD